jgi:hypothetical protein
LAGEEEGWEGGGRVKAGKTMYRRG